ncbi:MAG TPA: asparagine synthase (glutamine-hydrolyzing) [Pyrinomonadaceae bacterium]|nr:asparagine synthase (glutamine-hydrolyzing) [Pyrinomonadaceae bacterium]
MCGIAGIVRWNGTSPDQSEIDRMTAAIAHRGPDGVGILRRDNVALGHRRLAIIDPELGHQPMSNQDETLWLTYNGEMYNYRELKQELVSRGHRFTTNSDTEVVIHAYQEWGADCLKKFRGMFAFALADFRNRKLFLARDHFGIKPLYYRVGAGYLAFASELAALREVDDQVPGGNLWALELYLRYQYIPTPHTVYQDVYKLPTASYLLLDFDGPCGAPIKYWDINFRAEAGRSDQEWEEEADAVITDSVKAHLVADVPFGVFLSGGIDSSLVAMKMSRILDRPVQAFAIGFREKEYSELAYARQVAERCGIELHTKVVEDDSLDFLPELIAHYGEPFGDSSAIPTWHVSKLAREHVPMVLSGDGGDEGFAGYGTYDHWMKTDPLRLAREDFSRRGLRASFYWARQAVRTRLTTGSWHDLAAWEDILLYVNEASRRALWRDDHHGLIARGCEAFEEADRRARRHDRVAYAQYLDHHTYLPCDILTKVDVASMYHGLEVRTPLIDVRVMGLAARLPLDQRLGRNGSSERIPKYLLKKILGRTFPSDFVNRKKQGFAIPRDLWFQPGQPAREMLESVLLDRGSRLHEFFNPNEVRAQLGIHSEERDNSNALWLLLVLGIWLGQNPHVSFS